MNARQIRGEDIARRLPIQRRGAKWLVPSQSGNAPYVVDVTSKTPTCTCPDYELTGRKCKHLYAVQALAAADVTDEADAVQPMLKFPRPTYRQDWQAYNLAQTNEKRHFQDMLADLCRDIADLPRQPGAGRTRLPMHEMVFAACFKVYSTVSCRRFISDLADAESKGYLSRVPHFNSIFNYLELPEMTAVLRSLIERSSLPMKAIETKFAVDASGFTTCRYVRWYDAKYGAEMERHDWVKAHLMCGTTTNIVAAVEISGAYGADTTRFQGLVDATAKNFKMDEVSADKAYLSKDNLEHVANYGAMPYIPFKSNTSTERSRTSLWDALYYCFMWRREDFLEHYHRRSMVESTFSMLKAKFGETLRSKGDTAQINELLCKVLCHNICCVIQSMYELGIEAEFGGG